MPTWCMSRIHPPWFWTPYVLWLGFADWVSERLHITHRQAAAAAVQAVRQEGYPFIRRVGVGVLLVGLLVLFAIHFAGPTLKSVAPQIPVDAVLPGTIALSLLSILFVAFLIVRGVIRVLRRTYARGLRVLEHRGLLHD